MGTTPTRTSPPDAQVGGCDERQVRIVLRFVVTRLHSEDLHLRFSREALPQGQESLAKKCFQMFAGTAEEEGYRKFCEQFEQFEKFRIIEDSTD